MLILRLVICGLLVLISAAPRAEGAEPRRVLLLHSFGRDFAPFEPEDVRYVADLGWLPAVPFPDDLDDVEPKVHLRVTEALEVVDRRPRKGLLLGAVHRRQGRPEIFAAPRLDTPSQPRQAQILATRWFPPDVRR